MQDGVRAWVRVRWTVGAVPLPVGWLYLHGAEVRGRWSESSWGERRATASAERAAASAHTSERRRAIAKANKGEGDVAYDECTRRRVGPREAVELFYVGWRPRGRYFRRLLGRGLGCSQIPHEAAGATEKANIGHEKEKTDHADAASPHHLDVFG